MTVSAWEGAELMLCSPGRGRPPAGSTGTGELDASASLCQTGQILRPPHPPGMLLVPTAALLSVWGRGALPPHLDLLILFVSAGTEVSSLCQNGGLCVDSGPSYFCHCPPGFQGSMCQDRANPCQSRPCQHGATCVAQPNGYLCQVSGVRVTGWTGHGSSRHGGA